MQLQHSKKNIISGAATGLAAVLSYCCIAFVAMPANITFLLAMIFPAGLVVFFYSVREYIAAIADNYCNRLSFLFCCMAAVMVAIMLAAQIGVQTMVQVAGGDTAGKLAKANLRSVDAGIDVAWDFFISLSMLLFCAAVYKVPRLRWWGLPSALLALLLLVLNIYAFPEPPADKGLFDAGPLIALFWLLLQVRMLITGLRMR